MVAESILWESFVLVTLIMPNYFCEMEHQYNVVP